MAIHYGDRDIDRLLRARTCGEMAAVATANMSEEEQREFWQTLDEEFERDFPPLHVLLDTGHA
jgi:hypothetical protein